MSLSVIFCGWLAGFFLGKTEYQYAGATTPQNPLAFLYFGAKIGMMRFLLFGFLGLFPALLFSQNIYDPALAELLPPDDPFPFGVASGDPRPDGVVLWTRLYPTPAAAGQTAVEVEWQISQDSLGRGVVQNGTATALLERGFTVKILVENLEAGTTYWYRFGTGQHTSPTGRTRTAPADGVQLLRFAVASCSDYRSGYFNAYEHIARRNDLDAVIHLGDYIYEYGNRKWGPKRQQKTQIRRHLPDHTLHTLSDYRTRYAQHRLDPQLQDCHRRHPFITVWDDHEIANDLNASFPDAEREAAAREAYFEWMPVADNPERSIVRQLKFGDLAEMWMLDTRLEGRSPQARSVDDPSLHSPQRTMLGEEQRQWMLDGMAASQARWKVLGNQVVFSPLHDSRVFNRTPKVRMDRWDGYPAERQLLFDFFAENNLENIVVLTGDVHTSWSFELTPAPLDEAVYDRRTGQGVIGAEFVTPSVTSFNFNEVVPGIIAAEAKRRLTRCKHNPHLRYLNLTQHGYLTLTLTPEAARADWFFLKKTKPDRLRARHRGSCVYPAGGPRMQGD